VSEPGTRDERAQHLLMGGLDGELSAEEREELNRLLDADPSLRAEWKRLTRVKEVTKTMTMRTPPDEIWEDYWTSVYNRIERWVGWIFVSLGAIVLLSYVLWQAVQEFLADASLPGFVKIAVLITVVGVAALVVSVFREKLSLRRNDPYKEIQR
jgi:ferric-dicitrate binding protein FerR (iron transport regulator)